MCPIQPSSPPIFRTRRPLENLYPVTDMKCQVPSRLKHTSANPWRLYKRKTHLGLKIIHRDDVHWLRTDFGLGFQWRRRRRRPLGCSRDRRTMCTGRWCIGWRRLLRTQTWWGWRRRFFKGTAWRWWCTRERRRRSRGAGQASLASLTTIGLYHLG